MSTLPALPDILPFHLLVAWPSEAGPAAGPVTIASGEDLATAVQRLGGRVQLDAPNLLVKGGEPIRDALAIGDMDIFTPAGLAAQVPLFARGLALRDALQEAQRKGEDLDPVLGHYPELTALTAAAYMAGSAAKGAAGNGAGAKATPSAAPPPTESGEGGGDDLDRLFEMVETPKESSGEGGSEGARLVQSFLNKERRTSGKGRTRARDAGPVAAVNALLADQLAALLETPELRAAERFWRGLRLLCEAVDFRSGHRLQVIRAPRAELPERIGRIDPGEAPWSAIMVDAELDASSRDMEWLTALAETAESARVPAVLALSPRFFGSETLPAELPYPRTVLDGAAYDGWRSFRRKPESRWTALALNRVLLRGPHAAERRKSLGLAEPVSVRSELCWGSPAWLVAAAMARSAALTDWPTEITGQGDAATEGLPLWSWDDDDPDSPQLPLETLLDAETCRDLADCGILPVSCRRNRDTAFVALAPLAHQPEVYGDESMTAASRAMASLPYQLGAARLLQDVEALLSAIGELDDHAAQRLQAALQHHLGGTGSGAEVRTALDPDPDRAGRSLLTIEIRLGRRVAGGARYQFALPV